MSTPRTATLVTLWSLILAGLLNVEALEARVALTPDAPSRQLVLAVIRPALGVAQTLGLTRPRHWLRVAAGREPSAWKEPEGGAVPSGEVPAAAAPVEEPVPEEVQQPTLPKPPVAPVEVWVVGDSLINMGGPRIASLLESELDARVWVDSRPNTGLVRPDYYDWPAALRARLESEPTPHLVLVLMGANDGQHMRVDGTRTERWSAPWSAEYANRVGRVMDLLTDAGARVGWLGLPGMRRRAHQRTADTLNRILVGEAHLRPAVRLIPTEHRFAYAGRRFSTHLNRPDGQRFVARASDGVHFTWSGSRVLADHVVAEVRDIWPELFATPGWSGTR